MIENDQPDGELSPELLNSLNQIKDRCLPPEKFWYKTFYSLLFLCSLIPFLVHSMVDTGMQWDSLRMVHGLLPVEALMIRNMIIPTLLPAAVLLSFVLSFRFRFLRTATFLAWFSLILLILSMLDLLFLGMFTLHISIRSGLHANS